MSVAQVELSEKRNGLEPSERDDSLLVFQANISGNNFLLLYQFVNDKLASATYMLKENFINKNNYVNVFGSFKAQLIENYGEPSTDRTVWSNNLYKNDPGNIGMAYSTGHVMTFTEWKRENMDIEAQLFGENFNINMLIIYTSKEFGPELQQSKEDKAKGQL